MISRRQAMGAFRARRSLGFRAYQAADIALANGCRHLLLPTSVGGITDVGYFLSFHVAVWRPCLRLHTDTHTHTQSEYTDARRAIVYRRALVFALE